MEMKSNRFLQSIFVLLFLLTRTNFNAKNKCLNFGIIYKNLSHQEGFVWLAECSSPRLWVTTMKQNFTILPLNHYCTKKYQKIFFSGREFLKIGFPEKELSTYFKYAINKMYSIQEPKGIAESKFTGYLNQIESSSSDELGYVNNLNRKHSNYSSRKTKSEILIRDVTRTDTNFSTRSYTEKNNLNQRDKNLSLSLSHANTMALTFNLNLQNSTPLKYKINDLLLILSKNYDKESEFGTTLEENMSQSFADDYVATPSLDLPTIKNSLKVATVTSPSKVSVEESISSQHTTPSNAFELLGSIRSQPSFSDYNKESASMTSTPVMSNSAVYYSNTESVEAQEISVNYSSVTSSRMYSSTFSLETSSPGISSHANIFVSSAASDNFLNASDEY